MAAALIAMSVMTFTPAAHATRSLEDVLARLEALEKENASLRKRVQQLEATKRERPAVASLPATAPAPSGRAVRSTATPPSAAALAPAARQAYAMTSPVEARNWTGAYLGLSGGMRREDHTWTTKSFGGVFAAIPNSQDFNDTTARFGGFVGYNFQLTPRIVAGIEADFAWGKTSTGTSHGIPGTGGFPFPYIVNDTSSFETNWDASLRARIGALITPDTLVYLTGGAAWQRIKAQTTCDATLSPVCSTNSLIDTKSDTLTGWTLGAGVESALTGGWTARIEYRYSQYGDFNHLFFPLPGCLCEGNLDTSISLSTHTFIAGIAYRLGGY
ncbi:MAG: outer membrane beta-barrel protein [Pseudomonadota bacterium]